jgi:hypothetical protein
MSPSNRSISMTHQKHRLKYDSCHRNATNPATTRTTSPLLASSGIASEYGVQWLWAVLNKLFTVYLLYEMIPFQHCRASQAMIMAISVHHCCTSPISVASCFWPCTWCYPRVFDWLILAICITRKPFMFQDWYLVQLISTHDHVADKPPCHTVHVQMVVKGD